MPAFGDALTREEIDLILTYVQTLYEDKSWPRGEFNLPLALVTGKAFPEDEYYFKTTIGTEDAGSVMNKLVYEKRFGSQNQFEIVVPFGWQELSGPDGPNGEWAGGLGGGALEGGDPWAWDVVPEVHFTLNQRQHVMGNVGVRIPMTQTEGREPQLMVLFLWDWFDGGLLEGW